MTADATNRELQSYKYVSAYIKKTNPGWKLMKIQGMKAVCKRIEEEGD
ncbi:hypothetical protein ACFFGV_19705 [Pontibacillus salicampi]|uniref:Uncharacterized protein n=1 Tax=Pontibacillus salicampi TaxID=1449801 RepID=A0ABV6LU72_9BACI